jgi:hypothetical protein
MSKLRTLRDRFFIGASFPGRILPPGISDPWLLQYQKREPSRYDPIGGKRDGYDGPEMVKSN